MKKFKEMNLVLKIIIGMIFGLVLALLKVNLVDIFSPIAVFDVVGIFGTLFTSALKAVAPILVFVLIIHSISAHESANLTGMRNVVILYLIGTFTAAFVAVAISFINPITLSLTDVTDVTSAPSSLVEVFTTILANIMDNPINALATANYLGILSWSVIFGIMLRNAKSTTKDFLADVSNAVTKAVQFIISLAPFGIMGLVYSAVSTVGLNSILSYGELLVNLLISFGLVAFVLNPIIAFIYTRENPFPLVFTCLKESGITAFFTRSSAANIPVNIALAQKLDVDDELYNVSLPLGATINMAGAAITITVLTLATANSQGIEVTFGMAFILSVVAALSACGASGVAGGSLLLIPLACSLFGISPDVAAQVVAIGFIIGVIQDSCETALNSSSDILFTALVDRRQKINQN